jgi:hypothetical protein
MIILQTRLKHYEAPRNKETQNLISMSIFLLVLSFYFEIFVEKNHNSSYFKNF